MTTSGCNAGACCSFIMLIVIVVLIIALLAWQLDILSVKTAASYFSANTFSEASTSLSGTTACPQMIITFLPLSREDTDFQSTDFIGS